MAVPNAIVKGEYEGAKFHIENNTLGLYRDGGFVSYGTRVAVLSSSTIESIEVIGNTTKSSGLLEHMTTEFLFGTARAIGAANQNVIQVAINWKSGKRSLAEIDSEIYGELNKIMFTITATPTPRTVSSGSIPAPRTVPTNSISAPRTLSSSRTGKRIVCEMCDSSSILKEYGVYVCQSCGTKYSIEEAKKLMVNTSESSKQANTESEKVLTDDHKTQDDNDGPAITHNIDILNLDSNNWEEIYYPAYNLAAQCKTDEIKSAANNMKKCLISSLGLVKNIMDDSKLTLAINRMCKLSEEISLKLAKKSFEHYLRLIDDNECSSKHKENIILICDILFTLGDLLEQNFYGIDLGEWLDNRKKHGIDAAYIAWVGGCDILYDDTLECEEYDNIINKYGKKINYIYENRYKI